MNAVARLADVTVRYGHHVALTGASLEALPGQVRAVVGGDGAGKTTMLRTLAGAIRPDEGEVETVPLTRLGFMPTAAGVWRDLTVDQNIDFIAASQGIAGTTLKERRAQLLEGAGLTDARGRLAGALSGGMRQKLAFSLAMLHRPELVILDEPSTGVDPVSRVDLWRMISQAAADGAAIVMSTTYLDEAERAAHVTVLDAGEPLLTGTPAEVLASVPGHVTIDDQQGDRGLSWRRGHRYHHWHRHDPAAGVPRVADMEDAVVAASLAKEVARA